MSDSLFMKKFAFPRLKRPQKELVRMLNIYSYTLMNSF